MRISIVLLAAGNSMRFGTNKLLSELNGKQIITHAFDAVRACVNVCDAKAPCENSVSGYVNVETDRAPADVVVVTQYEEVAQLAEQYHFASIRNDFPEKGISYSVRLGVEHCQKADAILFVVCDQPFLTSKTLELMLQQADYEHILCCTYHSRRGNPTLFPKRYYKKLMELTGDEGGRVLIRRYPELVTEIEVGDEKELVDIDTREDIKSVKCT